MHVTFKRKAGKETRQVHRKIIYERPRSIRKCCVVTGSEEGQSRLRDEKEHSIKQQRNKLHRIEWDMRLRDRETKRPRNN